MSALADDLESSIETIQGTVEDISGVQGIVEAVSTVSTAVADISAELSSSLDELGGLQDVDDELRESFTDAEACNGVVPGKASRREDAGGAAEALPRDSSRCSARGRERDYAEEWPA